MDEIAAPLSWSDGEWVTIELGDQTAEDTAEISGDDAGGPLNFVRRVPPPVHRWAAAQLVRRHPPEWADVWECAQRLDTAGTGAALAWPLLTRTPGSASGLRSWLGVGPRLRPHPR
ncbi:MAG: hypothetical protein JWM18_4476 [Chloroflexi bacterium]|nr:hypothetical protein [Chloroflexota bacterium]